MFDSHTSQAGPDRVSGPHACVPCRHGVSFHEPLAIIGIGCRFPGGANDPVSFWQLLEDGVDAVTDVPPERWNARSFYDPHPAKPGKTQSRWGGFIEGIDRFDPHFFGISPREVTRMDPQQRLLLEVAWEALEDAGQPLERVSGSKAAVFAGISSWDYTVVQTNLRDRGFLDVHSNTGGSLSIAANRISYCFNFKGPSAAVDTACSSALVAVHLACRSIWQEGCTLALAGGVNALLLPDWYIGFSRLGVLSPDGRCKAFDARANGYVRSEGAGMVLLKPLSAALADGDRVYAVIRGTAMNQDGRTPGMTVPSQQAQEALLREALRNAGVEPAQVQYVEAHGTGTPVGDPIEARALGTVLSAGRPAGQPCLIGSVKTNIGHLEAGAGAAGIIKAALALYHRRIPGNLHFSRPNPEIDFEQLRLRVPQRCEPWPVSDGPALAGVNSFGYGGTNAHIVLEGCPEHRMSPFSRDAQRSAGAEDALRCASRLNGDGGSSPTSLLFPLSARSPEALRAAAGTIRQFLASSPEVTLRDIAGNLALRRSRHDHRLDVVAGSKQELDDHLKSFVEGQPAAGDVLGRVTAGQQPRLAFVCSGQGPQWWAMGRQLLEQEPVFRDVIERCHAVVRRLGPWSLLEELTADEVHSRMAVTVISQPAIFALQAGLAALWASWGIKPEAVIGHSVGEVAAAYIAGVFSLEDAVRVIYQRGRCMELAPSRGRMIAAGLTPDEARRLIEPYGDRLSLAAVNSPASVTISGEPEALEEVADHLEKGQIFCRFLQVQYAFHSAQMDPIRDELLASLDGLQPGRAALPFISTVTGRRVEGPELGPDYWWHNVRQTVRFADGVEQLIETGCDCIVELSPHPVLTTAVAECYQQRGKKVHLVASLRRKEEERATMLYSLGQLDTLGAAIDWPGMLGGPTRFVRLPLYPWQRERFWFESEESRVTRLLAPAHPLLGLSLGTPQPSWETRLDLRLFPALADHRVQRVAIVPAAAYVDMTFAVAQEVFGQPGCQLEEVRLVNPLFPGPEKPLRLQTLFQPEDGTVQVLSRGSDENSTWTTHFSAVVRSRPVPDDEAVSVEAFRQRCPRSYTGQECYTHFLKLGFDYGAAFQGIERGWQGEREALALVRLPEPLVGEAGEYPFHPALLDACFQVSIIADREFDRVVGGLYLPVDVERIRLHRACTNRPAGAPQRLWCHARLIEKTERWWISDIDIYDENGLPVAQLRKMRSQRVLSGSEEALDELLYEYQWKPQAWPDVSAATAEGSWLLFADRGGVGELLADYLHQTGTGCVLVFPGPTFEQLAADRYQINPGSAEDMVRLLQACQPGCAGIVHLWNLDAPASDQLNIPNLEAAQEPGLLSVLYLVQAWDKVAGDQSAQLVLVTRGAQSVGEKPQEIALAQSPVIGLGRVIVSEYPRLRCKMVDLDPIADEPGVLALFEELWVADDEDEIAVRGGQRFVHRYVPGKGQAARTTETARETPYRLTSSKPGTLDALAPRTLRRRQPGPQEVEIEVVASALNFSDVMKALGIYPGLPEGPVPLGIECSGRVTAVGEGVQNLHVGDEVMAVTPFAFSSHVIARADLVAPKPPPLSFEDAATMPLCFLTAAYGLEQLAHLSAGERVLIHSATGGVGLVALQLARRAGAEVFATAGTPEKRDYLRSLGVEHVMDSRSTVFADEVLERTAGQGVDVVLNSLAGEGLIRSVDVLGDYGRFLEIGKRDIYGNTKLGLRPFRKNLSFFAIDLDRMLREKPWVLGALFQRLVRETRAGQLQPLPHRDFPIADAVSAFRFMQHGKHIGKIVLSLRERPTAMSTSDEPVSFRKDGSYLITGGLGGFGLAVARWLAERGAGCLVLVGRRGAHTPEAQQTVAELEALGVRVEVMQADISQEADVASVLAQIDASQPPLRGVFHAAMVLEDSLLVNLDRDLMRRVIAPKVSGAWNLHSKTLDRPLDFFVLFSSLSSVFGHAGQGNYAAGNLFLDVLAHHRRALGLPALTVNWGYLGDVGYLSRRQQLGERLERQGVMSFTVRQALTLLERAMQRQAVQISVMRVDWSRWRGLGVTGRVSPRFSHLLTERQSAGTQPGALPSLDAVLTAASDERPPLLAAILRDKVARILGAAPDRLDSEKSLLNLGIDSLMAVELRNWIESELRVNLPIVELMRSPSLSRLNELLLEQLVVAEAGKDKLEGAQTISQPDGVAVETAAEHRNGWHAAGGDGGTEGSATEVRPEDVLADVNEMSSEQIDALLTALLAEKKSQSS